MIKAAPTHLNAALTAMTCSIVRLKGDPGGESKRGPVIPSPHSARVQLQTCAVPLAVFAAYMFARRPSRADLPWLVLFGAGIGLSVPLYFTGITQTDVIRAILLFYMLPIWTTMIDRLVFGIRLDIARALAVVIAFAGMWLLLGGDGGLPLPPGKYETWRVLDLVFDANGMTLR